MNNELTLDNLTKEQLVELVSRLVSKDVVEAKEITKEKNKEQVEKKSNKVAGRATRALTEEEYNKIIDAIVKGFKYKENGVVKIFRPKYYLALILTVQATIGLRISDILNLTIGDFKKGKLEIREIKTNKLVNRAIPSNLVELVLDYAMDNGLNYKSKLTKVTDKAIRKNLKIVTDYLGYKNIGTHSFRKLFATTIYNKEKDLELTRALLNHSSLAITQKYIGVTQEDMDAAVKDIDFSGTLSSLNNTR